MAEKTTRPLPHNRQSNYICMGNYTTLQDKWSLVYDAIGRMYGVHPKDLGMKEMFLAKYEPKNKAICAPILTGSEFSFILA